MEDFDVFTDEIIFTKPLYLNILNKFVKEVPTTPSGPNYQSGRKLLAEESLATANEIGCAFNLSESVAATLRTMAVYRDEQLKAAGNKLHKITGYIAPDSDLINSSTKLKGHTKLLNFLSDESGHVTETLKSFKIDEDVPFYRKYMAFGQQNNVDNFRRILKELPKEWTIVQLTAPYNPNENLKPLSEYRNDIKSIYVTMMTNDYLDGEPITVNVPANVTKEGERPLFTELYSLLDDNYKTIDKAQYLNSKRLVENYWNRREDIDLRLKSVINVMDKDWLGGWSCLLTGKLIDRRLRDKVVQLVETTITDWGFIKLTKKQRILLYNLIESCPQLNSNQIKSCIRRILTEHGDFEDMRPLLSDCKDCSKKFVFPNELCLRCLSECFEVLHHFKLVDGIRAFSQVVKVVKENDEWSCLKKAKRYPVVLIVDEMLDTFPWETLPLLFHHPISRMENLHFLYYLYKIHEKDISDGYFNAKADVGRYVINPEKNLDRMEKRMRSFVNYWRPDWTGHIGETPTPDQFLSCLTDAHIFLFCGHGDGCRFANGAGVEGSGARAVAILSGCGSVRLALPPGRGPPQSAHHHLHIAGSPMVVGMLWEVTDLEVDKVVSTLVALYAPSDAAPWPAVGKAQWSLGVLDTNVEQKCQFTPEPNLLKAIARARASTNFAMIASSVVGRGLPVRIQNK